MTPTSQNSHPHSQPMTAHWQDRLTLDGDGGSCLELCMPQGFVEGHSLANRGLHRRCVTNSLFQVNSRQARVSYVPPSVGPNQRKGNGSDIWMCRRQESGGEAPGPGFSSRQKGDKHRTSTCPGLRTRRAGEVLAAKGPKPLHLDTPSSTCFSGLSQSSSDFSAHRNPLGILLK